MKKKMISEWIYKKSNQNIPRSGCSRDQPLNSSGIDRTSS